MARQQTAHKARPDRDLARMVEGSKAPAISRAAAVLRLLGKSDAPLGVHTIARELGLVPSTCLHVLRALVSEHLVAFEPDTKRYSLDAGVLTLARQWLRRNRFSDLAQPVVDRIGREHAVTALGVHIVGIDHIIVVSLSQSGPSFRLSTQIGSRFPALISATGRCVAAFGNHPEHELEARFATLRWDDPPSFEAWKIQVERTRLEGFAVDEGNYISGVTVIAAPVWANGERLEHALVAIGIGSALKREGIGDLQKTVLDNASALSRQLTGGDEHRLPKSRPPS
jgi:DNA-binding IclR family transcriptional regulator